MNTDRRKVLVLGDSFEKLPEIGDSSVDSVVTDPPYGLAFMGNKWDEFSGSKELQRWSCRWASELTDFVDGG